jgi:UDP-N-acetylmuramoylalanine--D-glutamate ligase
MIGVSKNDTIPNVENDKIMGDSSKYNILFTLEVAKLFNLDIDKAVKSLNTFIPLPHRIEYVGEYSGIKFYDDAIATIPEACINSIKALRNVDTLIFGGLDRGVNLTSLEKYLNTGVVKNLICMPETGYKIADKLTNKDINIIKVETMEEAVDNAFKYTKNICLLAPAAASYNRYKNFEEKGNHYQELIRNHK